ncbi:MAG: 1-acyl-sn-glycerol-3-phosphate acyltransferase [Paracoccaceae bacterium]|jgi:1-acyl-sn-glycerol-3-phosphate acyltransferase
MGHNPRRRARDFKEPWLMQMIRSAIFVIFMYTLMGVLGILGLPWAIASRRGANRIMHLYCIITLWALRVLCGVRTEVRGTPPTGEVVVGSKHQSFLDVLILFHAVEDGRYVMKRSLRWAPVLGFYALRIGCAPVNRGAKAKAVKQLVYDAHKARRDAGQILIFPQGTRVAPGTHAPYKSGVHALAEAQGLRVVPAATNAGLFWPRIGVLRKPGVAVFEFLPPLADGLSRKEMMAALEKVVETASDALAAEARAADPRL